MGMPENLAALVAGFETLASTAALIRTETAERHRLGWDEARKQHSTNAVGPAEFEAALVDLAVASGLLTVEAVRVATPSRLYQAAHPSTNLLAGFADRWAAQVERELPPAA